MLYKGPAISVQRGICFIGDLYSGTPCWALFYSVYRCLKPSTTKSCFMPFSPTTGVIPEYNCCTPNFLSVSASQQTQPRAVGTMSGMRKQAVEWGWETGLSIN